MDGGCGVDTSDIPDYDEVNVTDCDCNNTRHWYVDVCNCDYPDSLPPSLEEVLPPGFIYSFVFVLGAIGNFLVVYVVARYRRMRSVTNIFLASLSTADLCLLFFCVPIKYLKYLSYTWTMGSFFCWSLHYMQLFVMSCSVLTLTAISVERYVAIAFPIRAVWLSSVGRTKRIVAFIWLLSAVLAVPAALGQTIIVNVTRRNRTAYWCKREFNSKDLEQAFALYQFVLLYLIPVVTMTFCYTVVARIVRMNQLQRFTDVDPFRNSSSRSCSIRLNSISGGANVAIATAPPVAFAGQRQTNFGVENATQQRLLLRKSSKMPDQSLKQIIQMLILVVVLFIICWTPYLFDELLVAFDFLCEYSFEPTLRNMRMTFSIMAFANSAINPLVYAFMSKHFRQTFLGVCCRCPRNERRMRQRFYSLHCGAPPTSPRLKIHFQ